MGPQSRLDLSAVLFAVGVFGVLWNRGAISILMCIEIMLNSVNLALVSINRAHPESHAGQVFAFFVIAVAAAEASVGLAILISIYRIKKSVESDRADLLKG